MKVPTLVDRSSSVKPASVGFRSLAVEASPGEAERWLRLAADEGERRAQYALYQLLERDGERLEEAERYRAMAADRGDPRVG